jgi:hypothetical protein
VIAPLVGMSPVIAEFLAWPFLGTNCGGNSAAMTTCGILVARLEYWAEQHPGQPFDFNRADPRFRNELKQLADCCWIRSGLFLARANGVVIDRDGPSQIVVVCNRAFDNVPQRAFFKPPRTHAVGYSTGDVGLISEAEFAKLDLSAFVALP